MSSSAVRKQYFSRAARTITRQLDALDALGVATDQLKTAPDVNTRMLSELRALAKRGTPAIAGALYACSLPRRPWVQSLFDHFEFTDDEIVQLLTQFVRPGTADRYPVLDLSRQELTSVPAQITRVSVPSATIDALSGPLRYREIDLGYNKLARLTTRELRSLNHFEGIHLTALQLERLPPAIKELTNVIMLNVSWSELRALPPALYTLSRLRFLKLNWTRIATISERIVDLEFLSFIELAETPFLAALYAADEGDGPSNAQERHATKVRQLLRKMECEIVE